eukprot:scaffold24369_cov216-Skeletonema_marinoi.AAC.18
MTLGSWQLLPINRYCRQASTRRIKLNSEDTGGDTVICKLRVSDMAAWWRLPYMASFSRNLEAASRLLTQEDMYDVLMMYGKHDKPRVYKTVNAQVAAQPVSMKLIS